MLVLMHVMPDLRIRKPEEEPIFRMIGFKIKRSGPLFVDTPKRRRYERDDSYMPRHQATHQKSGWHALGGSAFRKVSGDAYSG